MKQVFRYVLATFYAIVLELSAQLTPGRPSGRARLSGIVSQVESIVAEIDDAQHEVRQAIGLRREEIDRLDEQNAEDGELLRQVGNIRSVLAGLVHKGG